MLSAVSSVRFPLLTSLQDLQHALFEMSLGGKLILAPVKVVHNCLDVGTGTGIWAIDFGMCTFVALEPTTLTRRLTATLQLGDEHPECQVYAYRDCTFQPAQRVTNSLSGYRRRPQPHPTNLGAPKCAVLRRRRRRRLALPAPV